MQNLKDKDILMYLDGEASEMQVKSINEWADSSAENKVSLQLSQRIHREIDLLKNYNPVDVDQEWSDFSNKLSTDSLNAGAEVTPENEIGVVPSTPGFEESPADEMLLLHYLDGTLSPKEQVAFDKFASSIPNASTDIYFSQRILNESAHIESYKTVDVDSEWNQFKTAVATTPVLRGASVIADPVVKRSGKVIPMWMRYAAAACLTLLLAALIWFVLPKDNYTSYSTGDQSYAFTMVDGSQIELEENTTLRYPKSIKKAHERRLYLNGQGRFDVAKIKDKPFTVEVSDGIGVNVLGTIFKVYSQEGFLKAVENIEGKVRAYSLSNPEIYVDMKRGDKYGWDGSGFVDINKPKEIDNSKEYQILYVLDYLMANSAWKVISSPNMPFDEEGVVKIDLEKPIQNILEDLKSRADFDYVPMDCDSCYRITRFAQSN